MLLTETMINDGVISHPAEWLTVYEVADDVYDQHRYLRCCSKDGDNLTLHREEQVSGLHGIVSLPLYQDSLARLTLGGDCL